MEALGGWSQLDGEPNPPVLSTLAHALPPAPWSPASGELVPEIQRLDNLGCHGLACEEWLGALQYHVAGQIESLVLLVLALSVLLV